MEAPLNIPSEDPADVIKASAGSQEEVKDSPPLQRKAVQAAVPGGILLVLAQAPEITRLLFPFIPDAWRDRALAIAGTIALVVGVLFSRTATKDSYEANGSQIRDLQKVVGVLLREKGERR